MACPLWIARTTSPSQIPSAVHTRPPGLTRPPEAPWSRPVRRGRARPAAEASVPRPAATSFGLGWLSACSSGLPANSCQRRIAPKLASAPGPHQPMLAQAELADPEPGQRARGALPDGQPQATGRSADLRSRGARRQDRRSDCRQLRHTQASQGAGLAEAARRWTFHFTPTLASWLNAVENFFSTLDLFKEHAGAAFL